MLVFKNQPKRLQTISSPPDQLLRLLENWFALVGSTVQIIFKYWTEEKSSCSLKNKKTTIGDEGKLTLKPER